MRCSKRWAKPVRPGFSFFEPTWYQVLTATTGVLWSSCTSTVRPLGRTNLVYLMSGIGIDAGSGALAAGFSAALVCAAAGNANAAGTTSDAAEPTDNAAPHSPPGC